MSRSEDMVGALLQQNRRLRRAPGIEQAAEQYWDLEAAWWALEARRWGSAYRKSLNYPWWKRLLLEFTPLPKAPL